MSSLDDVSGEMRGLPFDDTMANAFLGGRVVPDDAPPGYQDVARLVQAARSPAEPGELAGEHQLVAAFVAAVRTPVGVSGMTGEGRRTMLTKLLSAKVAAAAATVVLGGGAAAAATGSLPATLQSAVSSGLSHVGVSVPSPNSQASPHASARAGNAGGRSVSGADTYGLCTAYEAAATGTATNSNATGAQANSEALSQLAAAAKAKGETIQQYCANATPPSTVPSTPGSSYVPATPGAPTGTTSGAPSGTPSGAPSGTTSGAPSGTPSGAPSGTPSGAPSH